MHQGPHTCASTVYADAGTFTPTFFQLAWNPALAVNCQNHVYLAFEDDGNRIQLTTSSDWAGRTRLSLPDTFSTHGLSAGGCSEGSIVAGDGQIDMFYDDCFNGIDRWTTTDGLVFTRAVIPNNESPNSVSAARDGNGNLYVASERYTRSLQQWHSSLQTSADGWIPHLLGPTRFPSLAVTPSGEVHTLRWSADGETVAGSTFLYSNSLRDFQTWTELPSTIGYFHQDILPLIVDETRHQMHAAVPGTDGIRLCSAAHTGQASDTGTSWTCAAVGHGDAHGADLALAPDGTLHVAWLGSFGLEYANSLGSFLATNFPPQVRFGAPSNSTSAAIVPTAIFDPDGDDMSGEIHVGRHEHVASRLAPGGTIPFFFGFYTLRNPDNSYVSGPQLQFRPVGGATSWDTNLSRHQVPSLPAMVEVRLTNSDAVGGLIIMAWDDSGIVVGQGTFVPSMTFNHSETLPYKVDISALPEGDAMVAVAVSDGSSRRLGVHGFTKTVDQVWLELSSGGPTATNSLDSLSRSSP